MVMSLHERQAGCVRVSKMQSLQFSFMPHHRLHQREVERSTLVTVNFLSTEL